MLKFNNIRIRIGAAIVLFMLPILRVSAQDVEYFNEEDLSFKERIAIRTNVVGWVLTIPNVAFDYDIVNTPYDKRTVGLGLKGNWNTSHSRGGNAYDPEWVYNFFGVRLDYRFYWRQQPFDNRENFYGDWEREWINSSKGLGKLRARLNCFRASEKPKSHISIFAGPYFSAGSFSIKYPEVGRRGFYVGAGATGGVALPLYGYENGSALDLEFGGCIGLQYAHFGKQVGSNDPLTRNSFLPLLTDVRVSLVYRFRSISKQHTEIDYALIDRRYMDRLMDLDWDAATIYNDSIALLKGELDARNQEIALYKQQVESLEEFNSAFSLEYLTPYMYMMEAPKRYTRYNKDTLPKIHIDSIEQIVDPILLYVREEIDSIPHVTSAQIDKEFVNQYNNISDADGKVVNRTALIREIYTRLNSYIEDNNSKLVESTFGTDVYSEKLNKFNVQQQNRSLVDIVYKDSVRTIEMTSNEKIEWLNNIKKQVWADVEKRKRGEYPGRVEVPEVYDFLGKDTVSVDSVMLDSMRLDSMMLDSMMLDSTMLDSMMLDSTMLDSMRLDSMFVGVVLNDSLASDSALVDSLRRVARVDEAEAQAPKKDSRRASKSEAKSKKSAKAEKAEKSKKSKKSAKANLTVEVADSATVAAVTVDSVAASVSVPLTESVVAEAVADTTLQVISSEKTEKPAKVKKEKVEKSKKAKKTVEVKDAAEVEVADAAEKVDDAAEVEVSEKPAKAEKKKKEKKSKASKVKVVEDVNNDVKTDSLMTDSISTVDVVAPDSAPTDISVETAVGNIGTELYNLRNREYFIKKEDEELY